MTETSTAPHPSPKQCLIWCARDVFETLRLKEPAATVEVRELCPRGRYLRFDFGELPKGMTEAQRQSAFELEYEKFLKNPPPPPAWTN